jgi:hypothetical protein
MEGQGQPPSMSAGRLADEVEDSEPIGNIEWSAESYEDSGLFGQIAQLVEQWTENPCVAGSIPALPIRLVFSRMSKPHL